MKITNILLFCLVLNTCTIARKDFEPNIIVERAQYNIPAITRKTLGIKELEKLGL